MNLQEELKALQERIAEVEEQIKGEQTFPREDDEYWYMNENGDVLRDEWGDFGYEKSMFTIGNVFQNENEAEFAVEKLKVEEILRKYSRPFKKDENNYCLEFCPSDKAITTYCCQRYQTQGVIYFESAEKVQQAIDAAGEWQIKRFIFGMEV